MPWTVVAAGVTAAGGILAGDKTGSTNSTQDLTANNSSDTANVAGSILKGTTNTGQFQEGGTTTGQSQSTSQQSNSISSSTATTTAGASDDAIKGITSNLNAAQANSTDKSKTTDLVSNILTQAAMTFAPTKTAVAGAGLYNSSTLGLLSDFAEGSATAQAATGVLNYQAAQQSLAEGSASDLAKATATSSTTGSASNSTTATQLSALFSNVMQNMFSNTSVNTGQNLITANEGSQVGHSDQQTTSAGTSQQGGLSIVCTELVRQGKMDRALWVSNGRKFQQYSQLSKDSYYFWARPAVKYLQEHSDSKLSWVLTAVMLARCNGKWYGIAVVNTVTFFSGLVMLASQNTNDYPALEF